MLSSNARALLLILFQSNSTVKTVIPSVLSSLGDVYNYKSIASSGDQRWTNALISEVNDEQKLNHLNTKSIIDALERECNAQNILVAPMVHSIDCIKDTSNDPENDVFFAVAFNLKERVDQFPEDWFKATPYISSCAGFKRATVYKVIGDNPSYPFINIAIWSSLDSWKRAIATEESRQAHVHQNHVRRTPFIGQVFQPSSSN